MSTAKLAWLTDIHLNFLDKQERKLFYGEILSKNCDAVLISGDIAEATCLIEILNEMADQLEKPIYFILGNHDYYRGEINEVRNKAAILTKTHEHLFWLPASGIQVLNNDTILLGQDGWADGRLGDYQNSRVSLNDSRMILDLFQAKILGKFQLLDKMRQLADTDAKKMENDLAQAVKKNPKKIIILTHVPPFAEACMHEGVMSDQNWLPYFSSEVMGDVLNQAATINPSIEFLVLCGHTHSKAEYKPLGNLMVKAGSSKYCHPVVQELIVL
jgi:predicted MPP superfamily phosphohydrolase